MKSTDSIQLGCKNDILQNNILPKSLNFARLCRFITNIFHGCFDLLFKLFLIMMDDCKVCQ